MTTKKTCSVCGQKTDIYTTAHKNNPFVDNKIYPIVCFTCYFVPKIQEQKYDSEGLVLEETELPYCCDNLSTANELRAQGACDSIKYAKNCVEAVSKACRSAKKDKKPKTRPKAAWNIC